MYGQVGQGLFPRQRPVGRAGGLSSWPSLDSELAQSLLALAQRGGADRLPSLGLEEGKTGFTSPAQWPEGSQGTGWGLGLDISQPHSG